MQSNFGDRMMVQATWATPRATQVRATGFTPPPPPPDRDAPGRRGGGAGRGCGAGSQSTTALMPEYQQALAQGGAITKVWGTTTAERPTFWFDLPYEKGTIAAMEFVLQDNSRPARDVYRAAIATPDAPGIVSIQMPASVRPLEAGTLYKWFFKVRLQCDSSTSAVKPRIQKEEVYGWVQRVSPSTTLTSQLNQATPQQRAVLYAQHGIWFDALTTLAELRLANPQDIRLTEDWNRLLQTVGLEKLAAKPLIKCCNR
ncbi:MAG: DUF928 domain-containing protein [Leptolyngbyaceae cyanobacterium RU_5_1]|nr:DUF928 domain-containing protein [Leptolyngbyaceae cyanobacterium RU_5_1]